MDAKEQAQMEMLRLGLRRLQGKQQAALNYLDKAKEAQESKRPIGPWIIFAELTKILEEL